MCVKMDRVCDHCEENKAEICLEALSIRGTPEWREHTINFFVISMLDSQVVHLVEGSLIQQVQYCKLVSKMRCVLPSFDWAP